MLITGYFGTNNDEIKISKILHIIVIVAWWTALIYLVSVSLRLESFSVLNLIKCIWPYHVSYPDAVWRIWYADIFIQFSLIQPFVNKVINGVSRKAYTVLLFILIVICSVQIPYSTDGSTGLDLRQYILMYLIGGYIKKYKDKEINCFALLCGYLVCAVICCGLQVFGKRAIYWNYNYVLNIASAVLLFLLFSQMTIQSKAINRVSKSVFSMYVINIFADNTVFRNWFYCNVIRTQDYYNSKYMIVNFLVNLLVFFAMGLVLDKIRELIFRYTVDPLFKKIKVFNRNIKV